MVVLRREVCHGVTLGQQILCTLQLVMALGRDTTIISRTYNLPLTHIIASKRTLLMTAQNETCSVPSSSGQIMLPAKHTHHNQNTVRKEKHIQD